MSAARAIRSVKGITAAHRFDLNPRGELYEVIDRDGRPVTAPQPRPLAVIDCDALNYAAASGRRALARALGAVTPDEAKAADDIDRAYIHYAPDAEVLAY